MNNITSNPISSFIPTLPNLVKKTSVFRSFFSQPAATTSTQPLTNISTNVPNPTAALVRSAVFGTLNVSAEDAPLCKAIENGNIDECKKLLTPDDIGRLNRTGAVPLRIAIQKNQPSIVSLLIERGVRKDFAFEDQGVQLSPVSYAVKLGYTDCLVHLVKPGSNYFLNNIQTPEGTILHCALATDEKRENKIIEFLLENYPELHAYLEEKDLDGNTPLALCVLKNKLDELIILQRHGACLECRNNEKQTPLHLAAKLNRTDFIYYLAYCEGDLNAHDINHNLPVNLAPAGTKSHDILSSLMDLFKEKVSSSEYQLTAPLNLVFKGGGPKGLAYLGTYQVLFNKNLLNELVRIGGTSSGAITSTMVALGYSPTEIANALNKNFADFFDFDEALSPEMRDIFPDVIKAEKVSTKVESVANKIWANAHKMDFVKAWYWNGKSIADSLKIGVPFLFSFKGFCKGDKFYSWIEEKIKEKTNIPQCTFGELRKLVQKSGQNSFKHLHIFSTKINPTLKIVHFSSEDPSCDHIVIADAVRASMSIPYIFNAHKVRMRTKDSNGDFVKDDKGNFVLEHCPPDSLHTGEYMDGGILYNFPVECFDENGYVKQGLSLYDQHLSVFNKRTLAFDLYSPPPDQPVAPLPGTLSLFESIGQITSFYVSAEDTYLSLGDFRNQQRIVKIDNQGVDLLSFDLQQSQKDNLTRAGKLAGHSFFQNEVLSFGLPKGFKERAFTQLAHKYYFHQHYQSAFELYQEVQKMQGDATPCLERAMILSNLGHCLLSQNKIDDAIEYYKQAHTWTQRNAPDVLLPGYVYNAIALENLGVAYVCLKKYEDAEKSFRASFNIRNELHDSDDGLVEAWSLVNKLQNWIVDKTSIQYLRMYYDELREMRKTKVGDKADPIIATLSNAIGLCYYLEGDYRSAIPCYNDALKMQIELFTHSHRDMAKPYVGLGRCYVELEQEKEAIDCYQKALEITQLAYGERDFRSGNIYNSLVNAYGQISLNYQKALHYHKLALSIWQETRSDTDPILSIAYNNLGEDYNNLGSYSEALFHYNKSLGIRMQNLQERETPDLKKLITSSFTNLGDVYLKIGQFEPAEHFYTQALNIRKDVLGDKDKKTAASYNNLGNFYIETQEYKKALEYLLKAIEIESSQKEKLYYVTYLDNLGRCYTKLGQIEKAKETLDQVSNLRRTYPTTNKYVLARSCRNWGEYFSATKQYQQACEHFQNELNILKELQGRHIELAVCYHNLGNCYLSLNDKAKAFEYLNNAYKYAKNTLGESNSLTQSYLKDTAIGYSHILCQGDDQVD